MTMAAVIEAVTPNIAASCERPALKKSPLKTIAMYRDDCADAAFFTANENRA